MSGVWSTETLAQGDNQLKAVAIGGKALFAGGQAQFVSIFDSSTGTWSSEPVSVFLDASELGVTTLGVTGYVAGGNTIDTYTDTTPSAALSGALNGHIASRDSVTIFNTGDADLAAGYTVQLYASSNRTLTGAILVGSLNVQSPLAALSTASFHLQSKMPDSAAAGNYHLLAVVKDATGKVTPIAAEVETFRIRVPKAFSAARTNSAGKFSKVRIVALIRFRHDKLS